MSRWAPHARERLKDAALDLFAENGYEATTVAQIADRAGLNRATFFRHFSDKREILFDDEDQLVELFTAGIHDAEPEATLMQCLNAALASAGTLMTDDQREKAVRRRAVTAASIEVRERGLLKQRTIAHAITAALQQRGVEALTAQLAAELAMLAFSTALQRWAASDSDPFAPHAATALSELQARTAYLTDAV
ncbi:TetR family transcriptional regulator [Microlunatus endophyticus]|uniref:TetR family transcriptional regulator n=1 Tax=Microlunatus endophyticus TaxID=1716077 RepID=A0A917W8X9_9ACTN|nr:TetR/AcrR family transcriptional regulator [Microlunatus endophyticus]GGL80807.1 TetR family transcriptional regulator [Microlunatus endophyticus]